MSSNDSTDLGGVRDLRTRSTKDPDREDARAVHNPHEFGDDGPPLRERLLPETAGQWLGVAAAGLVLLGLVWYLAPIFGNVLTNKFVLAGLGILAAAATIYVKGRVDGLSTFQRLDKSVIYYGDGVDVRFVQDAGVDGRAQLVSPIKTVKFAGLRAVPLTLSDLPLNANRLKSKLDANATPDEQPVRDRLNASTVSEDTDTMGTVHVTHATDLAYDEYGRHSDRYASPPRVIDESVADDFREQHAELHQQYEQLQKQIELLKQSNEDMQSLRDSQTIPQFEQLMDSFEDLLQMVNTNPRSAPSRNGSSPDDVEKRAREALEDNR